MYISLNIYCIKLNKVKVYRSKEMTVKNNYLFENVYSKFGTRSKILKNIP